MKITYPLLLLAGMAHAAVAPVPLQVTDERGKKPSGVTVEAANPDEDGWYRLTVTKSKEDVVLLWPFDARATKPNGPEPVPVTVVKKGDAKILTSPRVVAMLAVPVLLGFRDSVATAALIGIDFGTIEKSIAALSSSEDPFEKGVGLLWDKKIPEAKDELAKALRARERVMTRIPSEIYPAAMLDGKALFEAGKFDDAAVAFQKAVKVRPSDMEARKRRAEALKKAGKPDAADEVLKKR